MSMRKFIISLMLSGLFQGNGAFAAEPEAQMLQKAERMVENMYRGFITISNTHVSDINVSYAKEQATEYFEHPDMNAPYEFKILNYNPQHYTTDVAVRAYVNDLYNMFRDAKYANYSLRYESPKATATRPPEYTRNEAPASIAQVIVRKSYVSGGRVMAALDDTLVISLGQNMKVQRWANKTSTHHIGSFSDDEILDVEQMKTDANLAYDRKEYQKSYDIYQQIVRKYPEEGDPYYRMAVILYKRKKEVNPNMKKKERRELVLGYLRKAVQYGGYSTRTCADNMHYWVTNGQRIKV